MGLEPRREDRQKRADHAADAAEPDVCERGGPIRGEQHGAYHYIHHIQSLTNNYTCKGLGGNSTGHTVCMYYINYKL